MRDLIQGNALSTLLVSVAASCLTYMQEAENTSTLTVLAKIISGLPDKLSCKPSMLCWKFWSPVGHFPHMMTGNSFLSCRTFSMHWTLPDQMSGNVGALCRTSAKVCGHVRHNSRGLKALTSIYWPPSLLWKCHRQENLRVLATFEAKIATSRHSGLQFS